MSAVVVIACDRAAIVNGQDVGTCTASIALRSSTIDDARRLAATQGWVHRPHGGGDRCPRCRRS